MASERDSVGAFRTMVLNGVLGLAGYWVARHGFRQPPGLPRALAAALLAWAWATLGMELLGPSGWLWFGPLLAWSSLGLVLGLVLRIGCPLGPDPAPTAPPGRSWEWEATLAIGLVLWGAILLGAGSLLLPVKRISDGPIYHLYFAARWWKAGRLFLIATPFGENAAPYFPAVGDLWFTWLMISWRGDRLAKAGQIPFLLLAALASYAIARRLGAGRPAAVLATCWFVSCAPFFLFSFEPNVDTILVAGYLVAVYFFLRFVLGDGESAPLALGALAAGGAWGTKATATVLIPPLLALTGLVVLWRSRGILRRCVRLGLLLGLPLVMAGSWFGRNAWLTGNPLYPLQVAAFGRVWLPGWYGPEAMRLSRYYLDPADGRALIDLLLVLFDPRLAPVWVAALAGAWAVGREGREQTGTGTSAALGSQSPFEQTGTGTSAALGSQSPFEQTGTGTSAALRSQSPFVRSTQDQGPRTEDQGPRRWVWGLSALVLLDAGLSWVLIPYRTQFRFLFPALGLAVVPLARLFERGRWIRTAAVALLGLHLLTPQAWPWAGTDEEGKIPWDQTSLVPNAHFPPIAFPLPAATVRALGLGNHPASGAALAFVVLGVLALVVARAWSRSIADPSPRRWGIVAAAAASLCTVGGLLAYPWGSDPRLRSFPRTMDYSRGWYLLDRVAGPRGARVAYAGTGYPYYLMGTGLRNEVRYINIDSHRDWLLHDYHRAARSLGRPTWPHPRPGWDRALPDVDAWLANLRAAGIQFLFVVRTNPADGWHNSAADAWFPIERRWADAHPEIFQPVSGPGPEDSTFRLYRVRFPDAPLVHSPSELGSGSR